MDLKTRQKFCNPTRPTPKISEDDQIRIHAILESLDFKNKFTSQVILDFLVNRSMEEARRIIYTGKMTEITAMTNFIDSRQDWCRDKIRKELLTKTK